MHPMQAGSVSPPTQTTPFRGAPPFRRTPGSSFPSGEPGVPAARVSSHPPPPPLYREPTSIMPRLSGAIEPPRHEPASNTPRAFRKVGIPWGVLVSITPRRFWAALPPPREPAQIAPRLLRKVSPLHREAASIGLCMPAVTILPVYRKRALIAQRSSGVVLPQGRESVMIAPHPIGSSALVVPTNFLGLDRKQKSNRRLNQTFPGLGFWEFEEILVRCGRGAGHRARMRRDWGRLHLLERRR